MKSKFFAIILGLLSLSSIGQIEGRYTMLKEFNDGQSITASVFGFGLTYKNLDGLNQLYNEYSKDRDWLTTTPSIPLLLPEFSFGMRESFSNNAMIEALFYYRYFITKSEGTSPLTDEETARKFWFYNTGLKLQFLKNIAEDVCFGGGLDLKYTQQNSDFDHTFKSGQTFIFSQWTQDFVTQIKWSPKRLNNYLALFAEANLPITRVDLTNFKQTFNLNDSSDKLNDWGLTFGFKISIE